MVPVGTHAVQSRQWESSDEKFSALRLCFKFLSFNISQTQFNKSLSCLDHHQRCCPFFFYRLFVDLFSFGEEKWAGKWPKLSIYPVVRKLYFLGIFMSAMSTNGSSNAAWLSVQSAARAQVAGFVSIRRAEAVWSDWMINIPPDDKGKQNELVCDGSSQPEDSQTWIAALTKFP